MTAIYSRSELYTLLSRAIKDNDASRIERVREALALLDKEEQPEEENVGKYSY